MKTRSEILKKIDTLKNMELDGLALEEREERDQAVNILQWAINSPDHAVLHCERFADY